MSHIIESPRARGIRYAVISGSKSRPEGRVSWLGLHTTARGAHVAARENYNGAYYVVRWTR